MEPRKMFFGIILLLAIFFAGCTQKPESQVLCSDGKTIVARTADCPVVDTSLLECEGASSVSRSYYEPSEKDSCYYSLALDRENVTLCKKVRSTDSYSTVTAAKCAAQIAIFQSDPAVCQNVGILYSDDCYSEFASKTKTPSVCDRISDEIEKNTCLNSYINANYYTIRDWSICERFSSNGYEKNYCYYTAASQMHETSYCDRMSNSSSSYGSLYDYRKGDCYGLVAKYTRTPNTCQSLSNQADRDLCYDYYATTYPYDIGACQSINDSYKRTECVRYANYTYQY